MPADAAAPLPIETGVRLHLVGKSGALAADGGGSAAPRTIAAELKLRDDATQDRLLAAIRAAVEGGASQVLLVAGADSGRRLVLVRPSHRHGLAAVVAAPMEPGLMLLSAQQLRQLFSLSNSEAEIALGILRGASLVEIAEDRHVQHETVRGQVKSLLRKMGVANQKQLIADLVLLAATLANVTAAGFTGEKA